VGRVVVAEPEGRSVRGPKCFRLYRSKQSASVTDHYYELPEKFSCAEVLDRASDSPDPSTRI
jgi:hypothetical protein